MANSKEQDALKAELKRLLKMPENSRCADCNAQGPTWASTNLGIFVCMRCSGIHRSLGTHISKVKSTVLDNWQPHMVERMRSVGNALAKEIYEDGVPSNYPKNFTDQHQLVSWIKNKYERKTWFNPSKDPELNDDDDDHGDNHNNHNNKYNHHDNHHHDNHDNHHHHAVIGHGSNELASRSSKFSQSAPSSPASFHDKHVHSSNFNQQRNNNLVHSAAIFSGESLLVDPPKPTTTNQANGADFANFADFGAFNHGTSNNFNNGSQNLTNSSDAFASANAFSFPSSAFSSPGVERRHDEFNLPTSPSVNAPPMTTPSQTNSAESDSRASSIKAIINNCYSSYQNSNQQRVASPMMTPGFNNNGTIAPGFNNNGTTSAFSNGTTMQGFNGTTSAFNNHGMPSSSPMMYSGVQQPMMINSPQINNNAMPAMHNPSPSMMQQNHFMNNNQYPSMTSSPMIGSSHFAQQQQQSSSLLSAFGNPSTTTPQPAADPFAVLMK